MIAVVGIDFVRIYGIKWINIYKSVNTQFASDSLFCCWIDEEAASELVLDHIPIKKSFGMIFLKVIYLICTFATHNQSSPHFIPFYLVFCVTVCVCVWIEWHFQHPLIWCPLSKKTPKRLMIVHFMWYNTHLAALCIHLMGKEDDRHEERRKKRGNPFTPSPCK